MVVFRNDLATGSLDALRWLAAPGPRRSARVTLGGPYPEDADTMAAHLHGTQSYLAGLGIELNGVGTFRSKDRRTVFLQPHSDQLVSQADSPDRDYSPHLTIYSGRDRVIAASLAAALADLRPLRLRVSGVERVVVGRVDSPLDHSVLENPPILDWLRSAGLAPSELVPANRDLRLQAVHTIVTGLNASR